jgi:hypothetical protein
MRHQHDHDLSALNARDVIEGCGILPLELADVSHMTDEAIAENIAGNPDATAFTDADGVALRIQMIRSGLSLSQAQSWPMETSVFAWCERFRLR